MNIMMKFILQALIVIAILIALIIVVSYFLFNNNINEGISIDDFNTFINFYNR